MRRNAEEHIWLLLLLLLLDREWILLVLLLDIAEIMQLGGLLLLFSQWLIRLIYIIITIDILTIP